MRYFLLIFIFVLSLSSWAQESYYAGLIKNLDTFSPKEIKTALHKITSYYHLKHPGDVDTLHLKNNPNFKMRKHTKLSYSAAKDVIYSNVEYIGESHNQIKLKPIHCDQYYQIEVPWGNGTKQALLANGFNIEHLRARSTFNPYGPPENAAEFDYMIADLHHLLIAQAQVNRARKSYPFAEVTPTSEAISKIELMALNESAGNNKLGTDLLSQNPNQIYFEPVDSSKGRIARSLFYFSIRYQWRMDPVEEFYLRKWHKEFKVTPEEIAWNNLVFSRQGNRNPFVDYPELIYSIDNLQRF